MKQFLLFTTKLDAPSGGMCDARKLFDDIESAGSWVEENLYRPEEKDKTGNLFSGYMVELFDLKEGTLLHATPQIIVEKDAATGEMKTRKSDKYQWVLCVPHWEE